MVTAATVTGALDAIAQAGGDPGLPTQIVDQTGSVVAIAYRDSSNQIQVTVPDSPSRSVSGAVQTVTGWIDQLAGTITQIGTQIQKVGNAVQGGAAGAQAGYNLPTNLTPYLLLAVGGLAVIMLARGRR
jgi:hypothetical protein